MKWIRTNKATFAFKEIKKIKDDFFLITTTDEPYKDTSVKWAIVDFAIYLGFNLDEIILTYDEHIKKIVPNIIFTKTEIRKFKDPIRENHIWKDVEWGKREKNYHSLGKDPGNVWIPVKSESGKIIEHTILPFAKVKQRFKKYLNVNNMTIIENFNKETQPTKSPLSSAELGKMKIENVDSSKVRNVINSQLSITSPPYWNLKNYKNSKQIGLKDTYSIYRNRLLKVYKNVFDSLDKDSLFILNVMNRKVNGKNILLERDHIEDLVSLSFKYVETIYWHKPSAVPTKKQLKNHFETFTIFVKGNYEFAWPLNFDSYKNEIDSKNIFRINNKFGSINKDKKHPAVFPIKLIEKLITTYSRPGNNILDPFSGTGTTIIASAKNGRNGFGWELSKEYIKITKERIKKIS